MKITVHVVSSTFVVSILSVPFILLRSFVRNNNNKYNEQRSSFTKNCETFQYAPIRYKYHDGAGPHHFLEIAMHPANIQISLR